MAGLKDAFPARMTEVPLVNSEANRQGGALPRYVLRLYVTGTSPRAQVAIDNLRRICEQDLRGQGLG